MSDTRSEKDEVEEQQPPQKKDGVISLQYVRNPKSIDESERRLALKFLLSHHMAGTLIGGGGRSINELMEVTDADIHVSNVTDHYPGTQDRVCYITGNARAVTLAHSLIWEMIGQQTYSRYDADRNCPWVPTEAKNRPGMHDRVEVEGKITVPYFAAGAVIGRSGATIRSISDEADVEIIMDTKEEGELTAERVIALRGTVSGCMRATALIVDKMGEEENGYKYICNGTTYAKAHLYVPPVNPPTHQSLGRSDRDRHERHDRGNHYEDSRDYRDDRRDGRRGGDRDRGSRNGRDRGGGYGHEFDRGYNERDRGYERDQQSHRKRSYSDVSREDYRDVREVKRPIGRVVQEVPIFAGDTASTFQDDAAFVGAQTLSASTIIELAIPDNIIGAILGAQGSSLAEIVSLSGAKIIVSKRGDYVDGTTNRLVTITGPPASAQTAHTLIVHKLKLAANNED